MALLTTKLWCYLSGGWLFLDRDSPEGIQLREFNWITFMVLLNLWIHYSIKIITRYQQKILTFMLEKLFSLNQKSRKGTHNKSICMPTHLLQNQFFFLSFRIWLTASQAELYICGCLIAAVLVVSCVHSECSVKIHKPIYFKQFRAPAFEVLKNSCLGVFFHTTPNICEKYF